MVVVDTIDTTTTTTTTTDDDDDVETLDEFKFVYAVTAGTLPSGLTLDTESGAITGVVGAGVVEDGSLPVEIQTTLKPPLEDSTNNNSSSSIISSGDITIISPGSIQLFISVTQLDSIFGSFVIPDASGRGGDNNTACKLSSHFLLFSALFSLLSLSSLFFLRSSRFSLLELPGCLTSACFPPAQLLPLHHNALSLYIYSVMFCSNPRV